MEGHLSGPEIISRSTVLLCGLMHLLNAAAANLICPTNN